MTCTGSVEHERTMRRFRRLIVNKIGYYEEVARHDDTRTFRRRRRRVKISPQERASRER